ncbi:hypothetical protein HanIR_Chr15g0784631 [Helianthus annuus]|nr:hypothetical protein HanIR_Chr15g0784631 [Helianthus annuus]
MSEVMYIINCSTSVQARFSGPNSIRKTKQFTKGVRGAPHMGSIPHLATLNQVIPYPLPF